MSETIVIVGAGHAGGRAAQALRVPTIIVHGDRDEVIPVKQSEELYARIRAEKALHVIPGADHRFSNPEQFRRTTELLVDWLGRYVATPVVSVP